MSITRRWGISHSHVFESAGPPGLYYVKCKYYLRIRLPKYLRKMMEKGVLPKDFESRLKEALGQKYRDGTPEVYLSTFKDSPEMTVIITTEDTYKKEIASAFSKRIKEILRDYLDVCIVVVYNKEQDSRVAFRLQGWKITKKGYIYCGRSR